MLICRRGLWFKTTVTVVNVLNRQPGITDV